MARPSPFRDPDFTRAVAQAFVDGLSRKQMCEMFGVRDPHTITAWRRDPRVKVIAHKMIEDRILQITRKVDGKIAYILERDDLTVTELLAIRKEFLGGALRGQTEKADAETIGEAQDWIMDNPDLVDTLLASFDKAGVKVPVE